MHDVTKFKKLNFLQSRSELQVKNIQLPVKMSEINYDQSGIESDEVGELFLGHDSSKLKP